MVENIRSMISKCILSSLLSSFRIRNHMLYRKQRDLQNALRFSDCYQCFVGVSVKILAEFQRRVVNKKK